MRPRILRHATWTLLLLLPKNLTAAAPTSSAASETRAAPAENPVKALVGGTLIDGYRATPVRNSVILVEGTRIKAVGTIDTLEVPPTAKSSPRRA